MHGAMKFLLVVAMLVVSAYAQGKKTPVAHPVHPPHGKTTPPVKINESDRNKRCPEGFQAIGKQCVQNLHAEAEVVCPPGTTQVDGKCAKLHGKREVCPAGFEEEDGQCFRVKRASPETECPHGFVLVGKDECAKRVQGPPTAHCPTGSVAKGENCVRKVTEPAKFVCPNGFKQEGNRCVRDETFDCTPPRHHNVRPTKGGGGGGKKGPATVEEFVIQSTCKRIFSEPARKVCENGHLEGKVCVSEVNVEAIIVPGKFREIRVPAVHQCPPGFNQEGKECERKEFAPPKFVCPPGTVDLDDKCATFQPPKIVCPPGFSLENDRQCIKTIFAAPIVEFTVTFECTGKNCANPHHQEHHHHGK